MVIRLLQYLKSCEQVIIKYKAREYILTKAEIDFIMKSLEVIRRFKVAFDETKSI